MLDYIYAEDWGILKEWDSIHIWKNTDIILLKTHRKEPQLGESSSSTAIQTCDKDYIYSLIKQIINPDLFDEIEESHSFSIWYKKDKEGKGYYLSEVQISHLESKA